MDKILFINACVRENSRTKLLADTLLAGLKGEIDEADLEKMDLRPFTKAMLDRRDELLAAQSYDDPALENARRFARADTIVFAAPYWDGSFPSALRVFVEHVMVNGITFTYGENGYPVGKCRAKKIYYVSTAGGPLGGSNLGFEYIRSLARLYWGIQDLKLIQAEGLDVFGADVEKLLADAKEEIRKEIG